MSVSKLIRLLNIHFLVNLGLQKYNTTLLIPPFKNTVTPFGPPTMVAVVVDFKDWAGDVRSPTPGT